MILVVLCGGSGTRLKDYSLPKPLNLINGKPSISYCLSNIPESIDTLHFIVAPYLLKYNFDTIVSNEFKNKKCIFHYLPYFTRGSIESAMLGTTEITSSETIVFLDNDVLYKFPPDFFNDNINNRVSSAFLGYSIDNTGSEAFSFLQTDSDSNVIEYMEKKRISDKFCCGVYGFKNITQFRHYANFILSSDNLMTNELYMSLIYKLILLDNEPIKAINFSSEIIHIGTLKELDNTYAKISKSPMRVCFDLDNTLVSYPVIPNDYSSVKPIQSMIDLARQMKTEGHTIIIHTARRMLTHKNNVGAVIKDIGLQTFKTLEEFQIPYDELIFGKPIADIYIDDRSANPYKLDSIKHMGYLGYNEIIKPINMLPTNKYNSISLNSVSNTINKKGLAIYLRGESYYYSQIPIELNIFNYFPKYFGTHQLDETTIELCLENIPSIPIYTLYQSKLLNIGYINKIIEFLDQLHNIKGFVDSLPSVEEVKSNYYLKLVKRFENKEDYPFEDSEIIQKQCLNKLSVYLNKLSSVDYSHNIKSFIHGDCWFSNILLDYKGNLKFIDMKGQINGRLTTGGDMMYDYGKLYQSILGYDAILYGHSIDETYSIELRTQFENLIIAKGILLDDLRIITFSLVIGTLHFIDNKIKKLNVWNWIKTTFTE